MAPRHFSFFNLLLALHEVAALAQDFLFEPFRSSQVSPWRLFWSAGFSPSCQGVAAVQLFVIT